jgi:hypothetical protein
VSARTVCDVGIEVHGGRAVVLIPRGSPAPMARSLTFTTVTDGQRNVEVRVVRCGQAGRPSGVVGRFLLPGVREGPRGRARIDIGLSLDREGILRAWAAERASVVRQEAAFPALWILTPGARIAAASALAERVPALGSDAGPEAATARATIAVEIDFIRRVVPAPAVPAESTALTGASPGGTR